MSVVDSSALVAVLLGEPGWQQIQARLEALQPWRISVVSLVEASMVIESRLGAAGNVAHHGLVGDVEAGDLRFAAVVTADRGGVHPPWKNLPSPPRLIVPADSSRP
jgi:uncharacterized protein with PIN domain